MTQPDVQFLDSNNLCKQIYNSFNKCLIIRQKQKQKTKDYTIKKAIHKWKISNSKNNSSAYTQEGKKGNYQVNATSSEGTNLLEKQRVFTGKQN